jgi:hypothetical protein
MQCAEALSYKYTGPANNFPLRILRNTLAMKADKIAPAQRARKKIPKS